MSLPKWACRNTKSIQLLHGITVAVCDLPNRHIQAQDRVVLCDCGCDCELHDCDSDNGKRLSTGLTPSPAPPFKVEFSENQEGGYKIVICRPPGTPIS